ncbi:Aspartyl/glutamyl-tRNA(Asn/Gln) amidotransferase C subunit [Penicillium cf. griseofulvum]|nr:Aspartyl/glutamyl-tRNA(Asn/Gln) amidotransferase C subunit [Penicillium cf. griseofulvum]
MTSIRTAARLSKSLRLGPPRLSMAFSRFYSSKKSDTTQIETILGAPNWSVRSLLPNPASKPPPSITPDQLHHLLRISALPQPANQEEEQSMLDILESQIHFVKEIQLVDTTGVAPLARIRDESPAAMQEEMIGIEKLREALAKEKVSGRRGKIQRIPGEKKIVRMEQPGMGMPSGPRQRQRGNISLLKSAIELFSQFSMALEHAGGINIPHEAKQSDINMVRCFCLRLLVE